MATAVKARVVTMKSKPKPDAYKPPPGAKQGKGVEATGTLPKPKPKEGGGSSGRGSQSAPRKDVPAPHKTISEHFPLPKDVRPGQIDYSDVDRLNTYINRLKTDMRKPLPANASDVAKKRRADQEAALTKYTARKSRYRVAIGDTAAARAKVNANSLKRKSK